MQDISGDESSSIFGDSTIRIDVSPALMPAFCDAYLYRSHNHQTQIKSFWGPRHSIHHMENMEINRECNILNVSWGLICSSILGTVPVVVA